MIVRPATAADAGTLLRWRNDPAVRAMSFNSGVVSPSDHALWLAAKLSDPQTELWIGEVDGRPIGQVRFDLTDGNVAAVSISVDPDGRGSGNGRSLLTAGMARQGLGAETLRAEVRPGNIASLRLFEHAGFSVRTADADRLVLERSTESSPSTPADDGPH